MKKFFFLLFFIALFTVPALADYTVDSVSYAAEVAENGQVAVNTTYQLTFTTMERNVSIPLPDQDVSRISVSDLRFSTEEQADGEYLVVRRRDGFAGVETIQVRYTVPRDQVFDPDENSLTFNILSSRWARAIGSVTFQCSLPKPFDQEPVVTSGYYGDLPAGDTGLSVTDYSFSGGLGERMAYDSLSVKLMLPEEYFRVHRTTVPVISITFLAVGMLAVLLLCLLYWRQALRSSAPTGAPRLLLPEGILPCQLPMVLDGQTVDVAAMVLEWANLGYVLLSLSGQGTVILTRNMSMGSERTPAEQALFHELFKKYDQVAAAPGRFRAAGARFRIAARKALYPVIFDRRGGNPAFVQVPCQILLGIGVGYLSYQTLPNGPGFVALAVFIGLIGLIYSVFLHRLTRAFASLRSFSWQTLLVWLIAAALLPVALLRGALPEYAFGLTACLFSAIATAPGPKRSERGTDAMSQAKGCRTFYRQASWQRLQLFQGETNRFFQLQLPRAVALGVERQFARRFERLSVPMPEWLEVPVSYVRTAEELLDLLRPMLRQLRDTFE